MKKQLFSGISNQLAFLVFGGIGLAGAVWIHPGLFFMIAGFGVAAMAASHEGVW